MKETLKRIRELLDELESTVPTEEPSFRESFQLFELPEIVANIVDFLQPALSSHEAVTYWYLFRHSIVSTGDVFVRASVGGLQEHVVSSSYRDAAALSRRSVNEALRGLREKGAVSLAGDTTQKGTLYRVHLPEEIALCREAMSRLQTEELPKVDPKSEADFYNIRENRHKIFERDKFLCHHCGKLLTRFSATLDHLQPASQGGDNSYGNLVTSCLQCNSQRGAQPLMDFLTRKREAKS